MALSLKSSKGSVNQNGKKTGKDEKKNTTKGVDTKEKKEEEVEVTEMSKHVRKGKSGKIESIELKLGTTVIQLDDAQLVLQQYQKLKLDQRFHLTSGFLSDLFRKLQPLEKGIHTRIEVDVLVRQFQDVNEGFKYKMDSKPRGFALIITNEKFYQIPGHPLSKGLTERQGAKTDADNLEAVLGNLNFKVVRKDNLKKWEMEHEIKTMANADHKTFDCFLLIMSSHGSIGKVYGSDGQQMIISQQLKLFKPDVCKDLKGKPKLCFFQACQMADDDDTIQEGAISKSKKQIADEKPRFIINDVDFLVGYSTLPGSLSYRTEQTASFYLNSLNKNLKEKGEVYDLISILEDVNRECSAKKAKYRAGDDNAVSTFVSCLRGPIFFQ